MTVTLTDERMLVDLGGPTSGIRCRFSAPSASASEARTVHGTIMDCRGRRRCGWGGRAIQCRSPAFDEIHRVVASVDASAGSVTVDRSHAATVEVAISVNGQDFSAPNTLSAQYIYYDPASWLVLDARPASGALTGNTSVAISGMGGVGFASLGDAACRFGNSQLVAASVLPESQRWTMHCRSPRLRSDEGSAHTHATVDLAVTLNGQDYLHPAGSHGPHFTFSPS